MSTTSTLSNLVPHQPFAGIYALGALAFELVRFPLWIVKYATPHGRQHPSWTFRQALSLRLFFSALYHIARLQPKTPLPLEPGKEQERFVVIPAAADEDGREEKYFHDVLVEDEDVRPGKVGATWYPAPLSKDSDMGDVCVVLHNHGGAYVTGDGRSQATSYLATQLLTHTPATHVLCPQYRLSTLPPSSTSNPFPAALQDVLTTYLHLLHTLRIPPSQIILSGDSAGGNACIALLRYLANHPSLDIPTPRACWLWSPWINPSDRSDEYTRTNTNYGTDYISFPFTLWGTSAFGGLDAERRLSSPYVNAKKDVFGTKVPVWVHVGGAEVLFFEVVEWVEKFREVKGNKVDMMMEEGAPHDMLLIGGTVGFDGVAERGARGAGTWLKSLE